MRKVATLATLLLGLAVVFWAPAVKAGETYRFGDQPPDEVSLCTSGRIVGPFGTSLHPAWS